MVNSRTKCIAKMLLEIDTDSVERLFEQSVELLEGRETFSFTGKAWKGKNSQNKSAQRLLCSKSPGC